MSSLPSRSPPGRPPGLLLLSEPACCKSQLQSCDVTSHAFSIYRDLQRFVFRSLDIFGAPKLTQDLQNAQELCQRAVLLFSSLFMCILWLYIPHGSDNASVMAAAPVVSVGERSTDFIVAVVAPGEKNILKYFSWCFSSPNYPLSDFSLRHLIRIAYVR